jgi:hypothetical protein
MMDDGDCGAIGGMAEETEALGDNLPQLHFVHHKTYVS